jgi:uncharacterized protein
VGTARVNFQECFGVDKPLIGMLHLRGADNVEKVAIAQEEIDQYLNNGVDAVIVEDYFATLPVVDAVLDYLASHRSDVVYGVNALRDMEAAFRLASKYSARFVQIDSVAGHLPADQDAEFAVRLAELRAAAEGVVLLGGVRFKYQPYLSGLPLRDDLALAAQRCDAVVVTGTGTGRQTDTTKIRRFRDLLGPDFPLIVGAGVTDKNVAQQLAHADGAIVGSFFKRFHRDDQPVETEHVTTLAAAVEAARRQHRRETPADLAGAHHAV